MSILGNFIGGERTEPKYNRILPVYNPATGVKQFDVALASEHETKAAIESAQNAFISWSKVTPLNRARIMFKFKELIEEHKTLKKKFLDEAYEALENGRGGRCDFLLMKYEQSSAALKRFDRPDAPKETIDWKSFLYQEPVKKEAQKSEEE